MMKKEKTDPENYTLAELLDNPDFITWVTFPNAQSDLYWNTLQDSYPHLIELVLEARAFIFSMRFGHKHMDLDAHEKLWEQIAEQTTHRKPRILASSLWLRTVAAAVFAIVLFGAAFYFYNHRQIEIYTEYGEIKEIILPDGSEVILNANSSLSYNPNLGNGEIRELWLKGEAYFKVKHLHKYDEIAKKDFFLVHTSKVNIEVLGTTFNVNDRRNSVKVALVEGKVSIELADRMQKALIMKPGEMVSYDLSRDTILRQIGSIDAKIAWKNGILVFEELSAEELFKQLEENYGYKAVFKNATIKQKRISGTFAAGNFDKLLNGIGRALGITIQKNENPRQLIIQ